MKIALRVSVLITDPPWDQPQCSCKRNNTNNLKGLKYNNQSFNKLMATNKSGHCEHLDVGYIQEIILYLDQLTPPPHTQIPEIW